MLTPLSMSCMVGESTGETLVSLRVMVQPPAGY